MYQARRQAGSSSYSPQVEEYSYLVVSMISNNLFGGYYTQAIHCNLMAGGVDEM